MTGGGYAAQTHIREQLQVTEARRFVTDSKNIIVKGSSAQLSSFKTKGQRLGTTEQEQSSTCMVEAPKQSKHQTSMRRCVTLVGNSGTPPFVPDGARDNRLGLV